MRRRRFLRGAPGAALALLGVLAVPASSGTLLFRSSHSFDGGGTDAAYGVAVTADRRVYAAGERAGDFYAIRYSTPLGVAASAAFNGGGVELARAVVADANGVYVVGEKDSHVLVVKYGASLNFLSSATLTIGLEDIARAAALDSSGSLYVAGHSFDGTSFRFMVLKYDSSLGLATQRLLALGAQSFAYGLAVDASGSPVVVGQGLDANWNVKLARLDPGTLAATASASFDSAGNDDQGRGVAVEPSGTIFVAAQKGATGSGIFDLLALRYSSSFAFLSSSTYDSGGDDRAYAAASDPGLGPVLCGQAAPGPVTYAVAIKYGAELVAVSSVTVADAAADRALACALDADGAVIAAGSEDNATTDLVTRRFAGRPQFSAATRSQQGVIGQVVTLTGENYAAGAAIALGDPSFVVNGAGAAGPTSFVINLDVPGGLALGRYSLTMTNSDGQSASSSTLLEVVKTVAVPTAAETSAQAIGPDGIIRVDVPAGTFPADIALTLSRPAAFPGETGSLLETGVGFEATEAPALSPTNPVVVRMGYDVDGINDAPENLLKIAYFDTPTSQWVELESTVDMLAKVVVATSTHLTVFQLMWTQPNAGDPGTVLVYPNPYKPGSSGRFGDAALPGVTFSRMPETFSLDIYDSSGRRVYQTENYSRRGRFQWDTVVTGGQRAPSGVYVFVVKDGIAGRVKKGKFVVIR